jgi:hypothetical protein
VRVSAMGARTLASATSIDGATGIGWFGGTLIPMRVV